MMRRKSLLKLLLTAVLVWCAAVACAQLTVNSSNNFLEITNNLIDVDEVILINGINSNTSLSYNATGTIQWYNHLGQLVSTTNMVPVTANTGYRLMVNGQKQMFVWVIDYSQYHYSPGELTVVESEDACERIQLTNTSTAPAILYGDSLGAMHTLTREFTLRYEDYVFTNDSIGEWEYMPRDTTIINFATIFLPAPFNHTTFYFFGDSFAEQMGLPMDSISVFYYAKAIKMYPRATVVERDGKNELDRSSQTDISGSAPLVVDFSANANVPIASFFKWTIYNFDNLQVMAHYNDPSFTYTFTETGSYIAKIEVTGDGTCEAIDSLRITARESYIEVPNVFTPNGDGVNDEFRVAFRSIKEYSIKIVNRNGVLVYSSNDPSKGWDGKINGRPAAEGTYYYFIEAYGSDTDPDRNNKRMKYKQSGAVNLLR